MFKPTDSKKPSMLPSLVKKLLILKGIVVILRQILEKVTELTLLVVKNTDGRNPSKEEMEPLSHTGATQSPVTEAGTASMHLVDAPSEIGGQEEKRVGGRHV
jgi:hypothetical protein